MKRQQDDANVLVRQSKMVHIHGFTLIELLIVMSIVFILVMVTVPVMTQFVESSRTESAQTSASIIYAIADNYLFDDIMVKRKDTFGCRNGCIIASTTTDPQHRLMIDVINQELNDLKGSYELIYLASGELQVTYTDADGVQGKHPNALVSSSTTTNTSVIITAPTGTYPTTPARP